MTGTAVVFLGAILIFVGLLLQVSPGSSEKKPPAASAPAKEAKVEHPNVYVLNCGNCEPPPQCYSCHGARRWRG